MKYRNDPQGGINTLTGVSISTDGRPKMSATSLREVGYFSP